MGCCWGREPGGEDAPRRGGRAPTDDLQLIVLVRDRRYGLITDGLQIIIPIDICWQSGWSALCFGLPWTRGGNLQFMSQGKLRASLGRGSGALLTQPRA